MSYILTILLLFVMIRSINAIPEERYRKIVVLGFFSRLFLYILTVADIVPIPDAHDDADNFHMTSLQNQMSSVNNWEYLTNYTVFLSVLYYITDSSRWFAQFVNLTFGVYILIYLRKIIRILDVDCRISKIILTLAALMPFYNIYSVVLMREAWISFFVIFSLYHFACWYLARGNNVRNIALCIGGVLAAMWMHAGVIGILVGYLLAFLTYYRDKNVVRISSSSYVAFFVIGLFLIVFLLNLNLFAEKIMVNDIDELGSYAETKSSGAGGGSDYLTWLDISSPTRLLLFSPLKMFYFMYSPIIFDWRGLNDIAAFLMDSLFYIAVSWFALTRKVGNEKFRLLKRYLIISIFVTTFLFSIGTSNSGTAIRHRAKMSSLMLTLWALSPSKKKKECRKTASFVNTINND